MWCPECGTPIKKGFSTCSNCKFIIRLTREIGREKDKKEENDNKISKLVEGIAEATEEKKDAEVKTAKIEIKIPEPKGFEKDIEVKTVTVEKIDEKILIQEDINNISVRASESVVFEKEESSKEPVEEPIWEEEKEISIKSVLSSDSDDKENDDNKTKETEETQLSQLQDNAKSKRDRKKRIGSLYERLIDNSFQNET